MFFLFLPLFSPFRLVKSRVGWFTMVHIKPSNHSIATEPSGDCKEPLSFDLFSNWKQLQSQMVHNISPLPRFPWNSRGFPLQFTGTRVNFVISFDVSTSPSRLEYWESGATNQSGWFRDMHFFLVDQKKQKQHQQPPYNEEIPHRNLT